MKRLRILTACTVIASCLVFFYKKRNPTTIGQGDGVVLKKEWLTANRHPVTPSAQIRPADQTFLTFPEWYLVFSPEEQANYFKSKTASSFPYYSHTYQFWESYRIVDNQIKGNYLPNPGYHFMIWVIGTSTTVEYTIKSWYELLIGRITDTKKVLTAEDKYTAEYTQDYVRFIKDHPWYEFNFREQLTKLWTKTPLWGNHFIRKIERRYILTSELLVKWGYGKLIGLGTQQVYDQALPTTAVLTTDGKISNLPRYDKFNEAITTLAREGKEFKEIAGNTSPILLTIVVPSSVQEKYTYAQIVFTQPIPSNPKAKRIAMAVPVSKLNSLLAQLLKDKIKIEHVFDF